MSFDPNSLLGGYSQAELEAAFSLVAPKDNWKMPINAALPLSTTAADVEMIAFAIMFFTGSEASFKFVKVVEDYETKMKPAKVTAPGYYAAVGA